MNLHIILSRLIVRLCILVRVAYITLLERKLLRYIQIRKGPNKVGFIGLFQPLSDALKLYIKDIRVPLRSNTIIFTIIPVLGFSLALTFWGLYPRYYNSYFYIYPFLIFLCLTSINVYIILLRGWASNSRYSLLGAMRASAQTISYEIRLILILLFPVIIRLSFDLLYVGQRYPSGILFLPILLAWFLTLLAETNRAPLDFAEGESELVSGFNVEYASGLFALLFLGEYTVILYMCVITIFFWGHTMGSIILIVLIVHIILISVLLVRGVYPRSRYDKLIYYCWKSILPLSLVRLGLFTIFL